MADLDQVAALQRDIIDRLNSLGTPMTADQVKSLVEGELAKLADSDFNRKLKFAGRNDSVLAGSKFARWGLDANDIEFLHDISLAQRKWGGPGPSESLQNAFKAVSNAKYLSDDEVRSIDRQAIENMFPRVPKSMHPQLAAILKANDAMDTAESGYGQQLVGAQYFSTLWDEARAASRIASLIDTFEMTAPTAYLPVAADIPEVFLVGESTASNSSAIATANTGSNRVTVTAKKFAIHQMWSGEMEEDSIVPFVPFLRQQLALSLAHYTDSAILNGDTTNAATGNINLDDADPADTKHYLAFDGLRHAGLVDNTANKTDAAGPVTLALLKGLQALMLDRTYLQDWGHPTVQSDLIYIADPSTADAIAMLDELLTVDKYGQLASVLNGEIAKIGLHPLISSIAMNLTEADGKCSDTATNNVKGQVVAFNRRGYKLGWLRRVKIETERLPATDQNRIVATMRMGFGRYSPTGAASGIESAAVLYDIAL